LPACAIADIELLSGPPGSDTSRDMPSAAPAGAAGTLGLRASSASGASAVW